MQPHVFKARCDGCCEYCGGYNSEPQHRVKVRHMKPLLILALLVPLGAQAGGFAPLRMSDPGETCYSWQGGHKSAGSFSKCQPSYEVVVLNQLPPPVLPSPIMMPMSAPVVQQTCAPPPKPVIRKRKPAPKRC